jgi:hypothetical protein
LTLISEPSQTESETLFTPNKNFKITTENRATLNSANETNTNAHRLMIDGSPNQGNSREYKRLTRT